MFLSLVVPTYTISKHLEELAIRAILSYRDQVDEVIISEDGGMYSPILAQMADIYIFTQNNRGFTTNVNRGWQNARGEYVAIVNSDTSLLSGHLKDLCIANKVTSPEISNQYVDFLAGAFFVVPSSVAKKRGYLIEDMKTYSSDSEYDARVRDIFVKVPSVRVYHEQAQSVKAAGIEGGAEQQRDREIYARLIKEGKAK